jgi:hypothetical protein
VAALDAQLVASEAAYKGVDVPRFEDAMDEGSLMLTCVADDVPPSVAARYHRLRGIRAFLKRDTEAAFDDLPEPDGVRLLI